MRFKTIILFHRGKGRYIRATSKKRVPNKSGWKSELSKDAKAHGLVHESLKTGKIMPEVKVM